MPSSNNNYYFKQKATIKTNIDMRIEKQRNTHMKNERTHTQRKKGMKKKITKKKKKKRKKKQ